MTKAELQEHVDELLENIDVLLEKIDEYTFERDRLREVLEAVDRSESFMSPKLRAMIRSTLQEAEG